MSRIAKSVRRSDSAVISNAAAVLLALSNARRLAIMSAVASTNQRSGPVRLAELAHELELDVRTLSKDVARLLEAGLLQYQNDFLTAEISSLAALSRSVTELTLLCRTIPEESPLRRYLSHGRITTLPKRPEDLESLAVELAGLLPMGVTLSEGEVNEILEPAGDDVARLRRLLVDCGLVTRTGSSDYRRRPLELGTAIQ